VIAYAVVEGIASRKEVISFFGTLFTGSEAEEDSDFWSFLAGFICDLYPEELMDTITNIKFGVAFRLVIEIS